MDAAIAAKLREKFPDDLVGKKPTIWCRACSKNDNRVCPEHKKAKCGECGQYVTTAHKHLSFVGHADVTDRLLETDADWDWKPYALDAKGLPALDEHGGLWINLTICGTTRIGYGAADGKRGSDAVKETIGDAIRNAAMRFGVALYLWGARFSPAEGEQEPEVDHTDGLVKPAKKPPAKRTEPVDDPAYVAELRDLIAGSETVDRLRDVWHLIVNAQKNKQITQDHGLSLKADWEKRGTALSKGAEAA